MTKKIIETRNKFTLNENISPALRKMQVGLGSFQRSAKKTGNTLNRRVTLPIGLAGAGILRVAYNFQDALNGIEANTRASTSEMGKLEAKALETAEATRFMGSEIAGGMEFLGKAGWEVPDILAGTRAIAELAAGTGNEFQRAADITSNIMASFEIGSDKIGGVTDLLAAVTSSANVDLEMLSETMKSVGPIAKGVGYTLKDTVAVAGFLGNMGIQGSLSGTALKNTITNLGAPASKARAILKKLGVDVVDKKTGGMRLMVDLFADLGDAMDGMSKTKRMEVLNAIIGKRALASATGMMSGIDQLREYAESLEDVDERARIMSEIRMQGFVGVVARLQSMTERLAIAFGDAGLVGETERLGESLIGVMKKTLAFTKTQPELTKMGLAIAGIALVLGPVLTALASIAILVTTISAPFIIIAGAIAAIAGYVYLMKKYGSNSSKAGKLFGYTEKYEQNGLDKILGRDRMPGQHAGDASIDSSLPSHLIPLSSIAELPSLLGQGIGLESKGRDAIGGEMRVKFENAPKGMRVENNAQGPGNSEITAEVGMAGFDYAY